MEKEYFADISYLLHRMGVLKEKERVIGFLDCAILLERATEKGVSYRIADPNTFKTYHLSTRKRALPSDRYASLKEKTLKWGNFDISLDLIEQSTTERAKALLENIFTELLPKQGMKFRTQQMELSVTMLDALEKKLIALCEAEVGTGKTHAYILASAVKNLFSEENKSTVISTSTIALQKALTEEYLPQISKVLKNDQILQSDLAYVVRKGKSHYLCDKRLRAYISSLVKHGIEADLVSTLKKLELGKSEIDLDTTSLANYVKQRICVDRCDPRCGLKDFCRYQQFLHRCRNSFYDFQIVNHNYLIADLLLKKRSDKRLLADFSAIIIDEAHKLPYVIQDMYGIRFSEFTIPRIVKRVVSVTTIPIKEATTLTSGNEKLFKLLSEQNKNAGALQVTTNVVTLIRVVMQELNNLMCNKALVRIADDRSVKNIFFDIDRVVLKLSDFIKPNDFIIWLESNKEGEHSLCALSKSLNESINSDLWNLSIPVIMTSGTISIKGDFSYLEHNAGLGEQESRIVRVTTNSPFDYDEQALLYLPLCMPFPDTRDGNYMKAVIDEIEAIIRATRGHTLILFTSYRMMEQVFMEIQNKDLAYPLFIMGRGKLNVIEEFRHSGNGVLFASDSAGEGIDLAGDILSSLIVVKLPFPIPNALSEHELALQGNFETYLNKEVIPTMLIKLRQWFGRGIRRETDTCVFSILDSRASGRYFKNITQALPQMRIARDLEEVHNFINVKKDNDYDSF